MTMLTEFFNDLNFWILIPSIIFFFLLFEGYLGKNLKYVTLNMGWLEYLLILISVFTLLYIYTSTDVILLDGDEDLVNKLSKSEVKVTDAININNPNLTIPAEPLSKGLSNVGIGAAVAGGMSAASTVVKNSSLPPATKLGVIAAGGTIGATLTVAAKAIDTISQEIVKNNIESRQEDNTSSLKDNTFSVRKDNLKTGGESINDYTSTDSESISDNTNSNPQDSCVAFSMEEPLSFNASNEIFNLLISNYYLHVIITYLLFNLIIILGSLYIINKEFKLLFLKKLLGITVYNLLFKIIKMYSKFSFYWIIIILIFLVISSIGSLYISNFILLHIKDICNILNNK